MKQDNVHPGHNVYKEWLEHSDKRDMLRAQQQFGIPAAEAVAQEIEQREQAMAQLESVAVRSAQLEEEA